MQKRQKFDWSKIRNRLVVWAEHWFVRSVLTTTLSIMLAFSVDRMYEEHKAHKQLSEILQSLSQEHLENISEIDSALAQQEILLKILMRHRYDSTSTLMEIASQPPYIPKPILKTTSLSRFLSNDVVKYNFELLSLLSALDVLHIEIQNHFRQIDEVLYSPATNEISNTGRLQKMLMFNMTSSAMAREKELKDNYKRLAEYLQKQGFINQK